VWKCVWFLYTRFIPFELLWVQQYFLLKQITVNVPLHFSSWSVYMLHLILKFNSVSKSLILLPLFGNNAAQVDKLSCLAQIKGQRLQNTHCKFQCLSRMSTLNSIFWQICVTHHTTWHSSDCIKFSWKVLPPVTTLNNLCIFVTANSMEFLFVTTDSLMPYFLTLMTLLVRLHKTVKSLFSRS
jgi:hypothetical protein